MLVNCIDFVKIEIYDVQTVMVPELTNAAHHIHPWLATSISILLLGFILFVIILCGDKAG